MDSSLVWKKRKDFIPSSAEKMEESTNITVGGRLDESGISSKTVPVHNRYYEIDHMDIVGCEK
jgi:hypothetical protein